ncbi:MAG: hypothetical protein HC805_06525, partial [Alkalinema sp. RL_2_19]|nr:hypothetical protein [Alkalinema sp. RL_2_19]
MRIQQQVWTIAHGWNQALISEGGDRVQLLLGFGSPAVLRQPGWQDELRQCYPNARLLGCSTAGEIVGTQVLDDSLVVTAIEFEQSQVKSAAIHLLPGESSFEAGQRLGQAIAPDGLVHVFVLSDGLQVNGSDLVRGLTAQLPAGVTLTVRIAVPGRVTSLSGPAERGLADVLDAVAGELVALELEDESVEALVLAHARVGH